jgi:hypothetical protein
MSQSPYIAVVLEGGLVQTIILEAWPPAVPLPRLSRPGGCASADG